MFTPIINFVCPMYLYTHGSFNLSFFLPYYLISFCTSVYLFIQQPSKIAIPSFTRVSRLLCQYLLPSPTELGEMTARTSLICVGFCQIHLPCRSHHQCSLSLLTLGLSRVSLLCLVPWSPCKQDCPYLFVASL